MRTQALFPERKAVDVPGHKLTGIFMAWVRDVDPATGLVNVELHDGSPIFKATCMALHANGAAGWVWLPQVDDLVVAAFLQGHKSLPVILGSLYATKDALPSTEQGAAVLKHQSGTVLTVEPSGDFTLIHKTGAEVRVEDHHITLESEGGMFEVLPTGDLKLTHPAGATETLDETKVEIDCGGTVLRITRSTGDVHIAHPSGATIDIGEIVSITAGSCNISVGASGEVDIFSPAAIRVGGGSKVVLDGAVTSAEISDGGGHHHHTIAGTSNTLLGG